MWILVEAGVDDLNVEAEDGHTLLMWAAEDHEMPLVRSLLSKGVSPDERCLTVPTSAAIQRGARRTYCQTAGMLVSGRTRLRAVSMRGKVRERLLFVC